MPDDSAKTMDAGLADGAKATREFFEFLDRWIASLPERGNTNIMVRGKILKARDLVNPPLIGALVQANLEAKIYRLLDEWAGSPVVS